MRELAEKEEIADNVISIDTARKLPKKMGEYPRAGVPEDGEVGKVLYLREQHKTSEEKVVLENGVIIGPRTLYVPGPF